MMTMVRPSWPVLWLAASAASLAAQQPARPALSAGDVADITRLVMLEDRRDFDLAALNRMLASAHPEVRRRAALTVGRLGDPRGRALARAASSDRDTAVAATAVFAVGQLKDTAAVAWLDSLLNASTSPLTVAREAASALGKIKTASARVSLAHFLATAPNVQRLAPVVGEALLSIGRVPARGDIAPIVRWATSGDLEVRWRAAWALFRPRDPAAVPELLRLVRDPSPLVRAWAVRGLSAARVDSSGIGRSEAASRLRAAVQDADRSVRTEAVRALGTYLDSASFDVLTRALDASDAWLSVSAAEGLGRMTNRSDDAVRLLARAAAPGRARALRITAMRSLLALSPSAAAAPVVALARDSSATSRLAALGAVAQLGAEYVRVAESLADDRDQEVRSQARRLRETFAGAQRDTIVGQGPSQNVRPIDTGRSESDYRRIVERWVVPQYQGAAPPVSRWQTSRGTIDIELYPGDAPLAVDDFVRSVEAGALRGVEFERVVPNFVDQQRAIRSSGVMRDEVNRRRLTRGNLSWASAGLDTGIPGYTLGIMPQPHNEGDFTSLGRVVRGMDVVDRIELGDQVTGVVMLPVGR